MDLDVGTVFFFFFWIGIHAWFSVKQRLEIGYHLVVSAAICDATRMNCMPQLWSEMQNLHLLARGHGCALSCFGDLHME